MQGVDRLWAGYRAFRKESYGQQRALFSRLARGQSPDVMIFACADSRADPALIFSASPGELFVYRNVANLVPAYSQSAQALGAAAAMEFAIENLKVRDIVVMGHASCGGINASLSTASGQTMGPFIGPWVSMLNKLRDQVLEDNRGSTEEQLQSAMEHAGVTNSLSNIATYPFAKAALDDGRLRLHGAWFSIASGELHWLDKAKGKFAPVPTEDILNSA